MQFSHEASVRVDGSPHVAVSDWSDIAKLPCILTHVRATAAGDAVDIGRMVIKLDGSHLEFAAQRTMCDSESICWQNLGPDDFEYILTIAVKKSDDGGAIVDVHCCYDPPGVLSDILEKLGSSKIFQRELEADLKRYAEGFLTHPCSLHSLPPDGAPSSALRALGIVPQ